MSVRHLPTMQIDVVWATDHEAFIAKRCLSVRSEAGDRVVARAEPVARRQGRAGGQVPSRT